MDAVCRWLGREIIRTIAILGQNVFNFENYRTVGTAASTISTKKLRTPGGLPMCVQLMLGLWNLALGRFLPASTDRPRGIKALALSLEPKVFLAGGPLATSM